MIRKYLPLALAVLLILHFAAISHAADDLVIADFEGASYGPGWIITGRAFGSGPVHGTVNGQRQVGGFAGQGLVDSGAAGDEATGTLTSPPFTINRNYLNLLIGGGALPNQTHIDLMVNGAVARTVSGIDDDHLAPYSWDVRSLRGKQASIRIVDDATGEWGHLEVDQITLSDVAANPDAANPAALYHESDRPQFHFTPAKGWMNDPNGLVWFDGEYHLFFQTDPNSTQQSGMMSWGHSVSTDLVHWTGLSVALSPDENGAVWSGSAVVDWKNASGFGDGKTPPLMAMYTAAKKPFSQSIAYSADRGRTWTKYSGNPVIEHIANENRDPHLVWHEATKRWVVVLFKDVDETFCWFSSPDLKHWTHLQDLKVPGCAECPDFFPMALDGEAKNVKWVFTNANGKYLVGTFDGETFRPEQDVRQVDYGRNFYAVQTYSDIPDSDGRRIQIAWMRNGRYPWMPFNQQMSFPAELTLRTTSDGPRLFRNPVREIATLHDSATGAEHRWNDVVLKDEVRPLAGIDGDLFDIHAEIDVGDAAEVGLLVRGQPIAYDARNEKLKALGAAPLPPVDGHLHLQLLVDRTSIETFGNGGRISVTGCFLPKASDRGVSLFSRGGKATVTSLVIDEIKSIWP